MKNFFKFLFLLSLSLNTLAQTPDCNCRTNFEEMYQKVKDNYAGFDIKTSGKKMKFEKMSKSTKAAASKISDPKACYELLKTWTAFFEDNHLFINHKNTADPAVDLTNVTTKSAAQPVQPYNSEEAFNAYLNQNFTKLDPLEGVYESDDRSYRIGIKKISDNNFVGFLVQKKDENWTVGKTKFEIEKLPSGTYKTNYYYADFSSEYSLGRLIKNYFIIENIYKFLKISPLPRVFVDNDDIVHKIPEYRVEKLDANTVLLTLPPFTVPNAIEYTKSLLDQNASLIGSSKNLIVDLRNNPGGDEAVFEPLFPYISDVTIVRKGSKIRATQENYILLENELKAVADVPQFSGLVKKLKILIDKMQQNMGSWIYAPDISFEPIKDIKSPKNVVILVNKNTASTAESISLEAKQSKKVVLMGSATKGAFDYTEVRDWGLPCYEWRVAVPLGLSYRLPATQYENKGITPDVIIPESEFDWVAYAQKYLNQKP